MLCCLGSMKTVKVFCYDWLLIEYENIELKGTYTSSTGSKETISDDSERKVGERRKGER